MSRQNWFHRQRQRFIADRLRTVGRINRRDIEKKFDVSTPQASVDIRDFIASDPSAMYYDSTATCYKSTIPPVTTEQAARLTNSELDTIRRWADHEGVDNREISLHYLRGLLNRITELESRQ